jgi:hypothetical protein
MKVCKRFCFAPIREDIRKDAPKSLAPHSGRPIGGQPVVTWSGDRAATVGPFSPRTSPLSVPLPVVLLRFFAEIQFPVVPVLPVV